jgi:CRISPR-associated endonuclease/helicase Cas3
LAEELLAASDQLILKTYPAGVGLLIIGPRKATDEPPVALDEGDDSSYGTRGPITLNDHTEHVLAEVKRVSSLNADENVRKDLELAARLHDLGKCDRRFQALLHGDRVAAATGPLLAKSALRPSTSDERARARAVAGVPPGWRHELLTLSLLTEATMEESPLHEASHRELVLHLIATHHGFCRAVAPIVDDSSPPPAAITWNGARLRSEQRQLWPRLDSGITDCFWRLVREFGWFGLAYLEALLRLADHRASAKERLISQPNE